MNIFDGLTMIGGLCLFLFGMSLLGTGLEKRAGSGLKRLLERMTSNRLAGFLTGLGITAVIQSSSATTVMVVGFVNSGLMTLRQAINVTIGANVGTTVTAWVLSLTGIQSDNMLVQLLKPSSFTPLLALFGIILFMLGRGSKKKDTGLIFLGFATLMFGMGTMSDAVAGLRNDPGFQNTFLMFSNPILGVLAGTVLTAIIQSSSASIGILQAISATGGVTYGSAIPIILGMDIGTCITALLASMGTNRNARRAAVVHLFFNVIGTVVFLGLFYLTDMIVAFVFVDHAANQLGIAIINTAFKLLNTALLLPMAGFLEKLACRVVPDSKQQMYTTELDKRLLATPSIAIGRCRTVTEDMAAAALRAVNQALDALDTRDMQNAKTIREDEALADRYEDMLGTYLVKLSSRAMSDTDSAESAKLLHIIGDLERISDHAVNILSSVEEMQDKKLVFSAQAQAELRTLSAAVRETLQLAIAAFSENNPERAARVEPLEQVVDALKEQLRSRHIYRLQRGSCSVEAGFVLSDLLTNLERVADHCSNIAGCVIEISHASFDLHEYLRDVRSGSTEFAALYRVYAEKYTLPAQ